MLIKSDEALCIRSVNDVSKWNAPFIQGGVYKIQKETDDAIWVWENYNIAFGNGQVFGNVPIEFGKQRSKVSTFWKKVEYVPYFYDFFTTIKEMRKQKIQKLDEEWKSSV